MSNRNSAAKATLSAYQRWEMASFDPVPPAPPNSEADEAAFEAELERLREAAHAQGIASGHVAGQALGYQAGYEQGHAQGFEQGRSEAREEAARLAALAETFKAALDGAQGAISETLVSLALDIAQQVVRQHVQHDPTALIAAAREVLAAEPALTGAPALIVSPADLPVVEAYLMEELQTRGWTVRTDPAVERGGCRAQAASGEVDAGIDTRWERVAAALGKVSTW
ncbi:flagellar assembly protein FliH [Paraburkholderia graminis]|jgi:flagellar assembly protein FliH|uniref:Flagellar assembly protein FliH n=2 Tax=Burkholderiaceae TaxID=119060 RepID=B1GBE0_PARG4|nr:flagellar assembly protein FliH [Burkholderia sp. HB1]AXF09449.1 flagellar assembly protein FliH [Paraburkholderia graminis]EDT06550.1 flagellar assembly protein FliH [Paraburkholderia graminis C4D1M]MDR6469641.1 flagellar assembly protein FliH [Paraburkholderia graminis]MDR6478229.1 flagellar assembly protein FliH [Paraburkholderia graminis]